MEFDYIIYNAFDPTIAALLKVALIYSHDDYGTLIFIAAVCGIGIGAMVALGKAAVEGKTNILTFTIPAVLGMIIYIALIGPRGTLHVYDSGTNQYQALDLPEIIVFIAGTTNYVERTLVNIIDDTTSYPTSNSSYRSDSGGISFNMMADAVEVIKSKRSRYFRLSIDNHISNCIAPALLYDDSSSVDDLDDQFILDVWDTLIGSYNGTTTWYDDLNRGGTMISCDQSAVRVRNEFDDLSSHEATVSEVCLKAGFNVGTPALLNQCRQLIESKAARGTANLDLLLQNAFLTNATMNAMSRSGNLQESIAIYSNRNQQTANIGAAQIANDWIPVIRAVVVAVTFGLTPLVGLFVVTPLFFRVLLFVTGMFIWLATWSVVDALIHSLAVDMSLKIFDGMVEGTIGMHEIIYMPDAMEKAAGVFAKSRTMAVTISTVIMYSIFKFGGMALAGMGSRFTENAQASGERAGMTAATAEGRGQAIRGAVDGAATDSVLGQHGHAAMTNAATYTQSAQVSGANQAIARFTGGDSSPDAAHRTARGVGNYTGHQVEKNIGAGNAMDAVNRVIGTTSENRGFHEAFSKESTSFADAVANIKTSGDVGKSVPEMQEDIALNKYATNAAAATVAQTGANMNTGGNIFSSKVGASPYETTMTGAQLKNSPMTAGMDLAHLGDNTPYKVTANSSDGSLTPESLSNVSIMNKEESGSATTRHNSDTTNAGANIGEWHSVWGQNGTREQKQGMLDKARNDEAYETGSIDALSQNSKTLSEGTLSQTDSREVTGQAGAMVAGSGAVTRLQYGSQDATRISAEGVENRAKFGQILDTLGANLNEAGENVDKQNEAYTEAIAATQKLYNANSSDKSEGYSAQVAAERPVEGTGNKSDLAQVESGMKTRLGDAVDFVAGLNPSSLAASLGERFNNLVTGSDTAEGPASPSRGLNSSEPLSSADQNEIAQEKGNGESLDEGMQQLVDEMNARNK